MFRYLVVSGHYPAIQKPICITGSNSPQEIRGNLAMPGYHKLSSIMVSDTFPLPQIDEALQAVHSSNQFHYLTSLRGTSSWP